MAEDNNNTSGPSAGTIIGAVGFDALINRMKAEGQLLRNSGTNSIKALKEEMFVQTDIQSRLLSSFESYFDKMSTHYEWVKDQAAKQEADRLQELAELRGRMGATVPDPPAAATDNSMDRFLPGFLTGGLIGGIVSAVGAAVAAALGAVGAAYGALSLPQAKQIFSGTKKVLFDPIAKIVTWLKGVPGRLGGQLGEWWTSTKAALNDELKNMDDMKAQDKAARGESSMIKKLKEWKAGIANTVSRMKAWTTKEFAWMGTMLKEIKALIPGLGADDAAKAADVAADLGSAKPPKDPSKLVQWISHKAGQFKNTVGQLLKPIGKILAPLAWIFSTMDGVREAMKQKEEATLAGDTETQQNIEMVTGFIGGFTGSFVGGFADFIKNSVLWVLKKVLPGDWIDEKTGKFKPGTMLGNIEEFSFAETIKKGFNLLGDNILNMIDDVIFFIDKQMVRFGLANEETTKRINERTYFDQSIADQARSEQMVTSSGFTNAAALTDQEIKSIAEEKSSFLGMSETEIINNLQKLRKRDQVQGLGENNLSYQELANLLKKPQVSQAEIRTQMMKDQQAQAEALQWAQAM